MRLRSLSVALLAGVVLVPVSASAASAAGPGTTVSGTAKTFKTSAAKRSKRAARTQAVQAPRTSPTTTTVAPAPSTTTVAPAPSTTTVAPAPSSVTYASRVLALTNAERTSRGLRALAFDSCADGFANSWAGRLASVGTLSHQPLSPIMVGCAARGAGENVAYGNATPEQLVQMWMASPGHRANILNAAFTHVGIGDLTTSTGRVYGVQVFLTR